MCPVTSGYDLFAGVETLPVRQTPEVAKIEALESRLTERYGHVLQNNDRLTRSLVSFQANKKRPLYRWYKYKEAFSASLVEECLSEAGIRSGRLLDPFAGSGTALFAGAEWGLDADGIELLPIGREIIQARQIVQNELTTAGVRVIQHWIDGKPWTKPGKRETLPVLRITVGAYSKTTLGSIERYLCLSRGESPAIGRILRFALLCVLESISFTRKDGQYLRWDRRSGKRNGSNSFNKGPIADFNEAVSEKLSELLDDTLSRNTFIPAGKARKNGGIRLFDGSCLDVLPTLKNATYRIVFTSPPYCNRYDYTRTYALELALLGVGATGIVDLRQRMLSCTVENRAKNLVDLNPKWESALSVFEQQALLREILGYLERRRAAGELNNSGIPRMVRGYFQEMACVLQECARVLKRGGTMIMVNDNVRYAGIGIPVDLILSDFASQFGFFVDKIMILPGSKGNSSQQMGEHGRAPLRKCVYVWSKP
jgi:DNA modification methylase